MSVIDFLLEGNAPTPGTSTSTTTSQLPEWYNEYTRNMLGKASAVAELPYATYGGPRIAGFTPDQIRGMDVAKTGAGAYKPFVTSATGALDKAGNISGFGAASPYLNKATGMSGANVFNPYATSALDAITKAGTSSSVSATEPYFGSAIAQSPLSAANPYLSAAMGTFPQAAAQYMSPYTSGVVNRIADLGVRQLQEKFLPAIGEEFTRSGQFGGSRMGEFGARALRDVQESVLGEQAKALESGYRTAAEIYGADVGRAADVAGTVGQLSTAQQRALLEAGINVGKLTSDDISRLLESGVRTADVGKTAGMLTQQDADLLARVGATAGQLSADDAKALMDLSARYGQLGKDVQGMGIKEGEVITGVGTAEQEMQQKNLDLAYQDFLSQQGYPQEQAEFLSKMLVNIKLPEVNIENRTDMPAQPGGPTGLEQIFGGAVGIDKLLELYNKYFPK